MLVSDFLKDSARTYPEKVAVVFEGRRETYAQLNDKANQLARTLIDHGLCRGDRVAVYMDNSLGAVISVFGILKAGGVLSVLNPAIKVDKLTYILRDSSATMLISDAKHVPVAVQAIRDAPSLSTMIIDGECKMCDSRPGVSLLSMDDTLKYQPTSPPAHQTIDLDLAAIIYTSGSTGSPKGVMATHLNIVSAASSITQYLENTASDVILNTLPLSFDYGLYQLLMAFKVGATLVLEKSFTFPYRVVDLMLRERVTGFPGVPTIFALLLQLRDLKKHDFSALRYVTNTAAALPVPYINRLRETFPQAKIYLMYGLTECKRVSYLPPEEIDRRPTSVGKAIPNTEVYIVDEDGRRLGPGVVGELVVRGSHVTLGYWGAPEETARVFRPGPLPGERVLHTGDYFKMDEDGYLYFIGRKDDMIKSRGERISPKEIEDVLYGLEGVIEAAAVGVPDAILGEAVKAVLVLRPGVNLSERQVRAYCSERLEDCMVPKIVEFWPALPKTLSGKINKNAIGAEACAVSSVR